MNSVSGNPKTRLEVQGTLENDQGETVQAEWVFVGKKPRLGCEFGFTTLTINECFCEHKIDDCQYYINDFNYILRIDGEDRLAAIRAAIGI